ncbi:hypothetical protein BH10CYA1_BH10CYA1_21030 [soil metagenome]
MTLIKFASLLSLVWIASTSGAFASQLAFTANGGNITAFEGDVESKSIGGVALPKGSISISGNTINVNAVPDWLFDRHNVLTGVVINPKLVTEGSSSVVTGLAYFTKGEWLTNLGRNQASEIVTLTNGMALAGHIGGTSSTALDMVLADGTRRSVNFSDVAAIQSPRAYPFRIPASSVKIEPSDGSYTAEVASVSFTPAMFHSHLALFSSNKPQVPKSTLPGTEGGVSNKYIATMIATDIIAGTIAPAIAIPIVFTRSTLHARQLQFINQNNGLAQPPFSPQIFGNGSVYFYPTK